MSNNFKPIESYKDLDSRFKNTTASPADFLAFAKKNGVLLAHSDIHKHRQGTMSRYACLAYNLYFRLRRTK